MRGGSRLSGSGGLTHPPTPDPHRRGPGGAWGARAGPYGPFAERVDTLRADRDFAADTATMDAGELEAVATAAARAGSVPAMRLMRSIIENRQSASAPADSLAPLDELAARRQEK